MKIAYYYSLLKIFADFISVFFAFLFAYFLRTTKLFVNLVSETSDFMSFSDFLIVDLKLAFLFIFLGFFLNLYSFGLNYNLKKDFIPLFKTFLTFVFAILAYFFIYRSFPFSRAVFLLGFVWSFVFLNFGRLKLSFFLSMLIKNLSLPKVAFCNLDSLEQDVFKSIYKYFKYFKKSYTFNELKKLNSKFDVIVIKNSENLQQFVDFAAFNQKQLFVLPFDLKLSHNFNDIKFLEFRTTTLVGWNRVLKRLFDIFVSAFLIILLSPVLILIAIFIKFGSKGPVLFTKNDNGDPIYRIMKNQEKFVMYKFRTMQDKSHSKRYTDLNSQNMRKGDPLVKIKNDPRVTPFGKFLRRFDLDELPQLFNVLKGDMSLVGPRPHLEEEVSKYALKHKYVFNVKPGITGLSQVSGRSDLSFEKEVQLDRFYIQNYSLLLDLKILFMTPWVILKGHSEFLGSKNNCKK